VSAPDEQMTARPLTSDAEFLAQLERLGRDWRYSDEFIGNIVRSRFPRDYARDPRRREERA
jgi:hypothetical protein